jgi:signal peptidase I
MSKLTRALFALFAFSSVHWAARNWRRALVWDALLVGSMMSLLWLPFWVLFVVMAAQIVDAVVFTPEREPFIGELWAALAIVNVAIVGISLTVRAHWVEAFKIPSGGDIPTLQVGDHIFAAKFARKPSRGEMIVFVYPKDPKFDFVKRVVAVGGDTIEMRDDVLVINGKPISRQRVDGPCEYDDEVDDRWEKRPCTAWDETIDGRTFGVVYDATREPRSFEARTIPPGEYFVMGDNRDNSHDSRFWGSVPAANVKGTARKIWWSAGPNGVRWDRIDKPVR